MNIGSFYVPDTNSPYSKKTRLKRCGVICVKFIFDVPHLLVVRGAVSHIWSLPKGCINEGETELECAIRETLEETGLKLDLTEANERLCINHNVYFIVQLVTHGKFKIIDKHEVDKVHWMTLPELRTVECNKDLRSILQYPQKKFTFHYSLEKILGLNSPMNLKSFYATVNKQEKLEKLAKKVIVPLQVHNVAHEVTPFKEYKMFETPLFHNLLLAVRKESTVPMLV